MNGIFICYRREDNRHAAGRLWDSLRQRFSTEQIFLDVDNVEPGLSFLEVIEARIAMCAAMLVLIGPDWLHAKNGEGGRRLDDPEDFVRFEIEVALKKGLRVIPVLTDGASIPRSAALPDPLKPLARRNAVTLNHESFPRDAEHLNNALAKIVIAPPSLDQSLDATPDGDKRWKAEFSERSWTRCEIHFWRDEEHHRIRVETAHVSTTEHVLLDGKAIMAFSMPGQKQVRFGIGGHQFELAFVFTWYERVKKVVLRVDGQLLISDEFVGTF